MTERIIPDGFTEGLFATPEDAHLEDDYEWEGLYWDDEPLTDSDYDLPEPFSVDNPNYNGLDSPF